MALCLLRHLETGPIPAPLVGPVPSQLTGIVRVSPVFAVSYLLQAVSFASPVPVVPVSHLSFGHGLPVLAVPRKLALASYYITLYNT